MGLKPNPYDLFSIKCFDTVGWLPFPAKVGALLLGAFLFCLHSAVLQVSKSFRDNNRSLNK